jgi:hypothetical protein
VLGAVPPGQRADMEVCGGVFVQHSVASWPAQPDCTTPMLLAVTACELTMSMAASR